MNITNPYISTIIKTPVILKPNKLNKNIKSNVYDELRMNYEKKCIENIGFVQEIGQIEELSQGIMIRENYSGDIKYNVVFQARVCNPQKNDFIICKITDLNPKIIRCENGPIICLIPIERINQDLFTYVNGKVIYNENKHILTNNDYIIVNIIDKRFDPNDNIIKAFGNLINLSDQVSMVENKNTVVSSFDNIDF